MHPVLLKILWILAHHSSSENNQFDLQNNATENIDDTPPTRKSARITRPVVRALHQDTWEEQARGPHSKLVIDAILKELDQLIKFNTWKPIRDSNEATKDTIHKSITGSKLIIEEKTDANGATLLWKARLVAQGRRHYTLL